MPTRILQYWLLVLLCLFCNDLYADTLSVFFPFNKSTLTEAAQQKMDSVLYAGGLKTDQVLRIVGYTDAVGGEDYNLQLSRKRAMAVKEYLLRSGFSEQNITLLIGRGEGNAQMAAQPGGFEPDRRVDIVPIRALKRERPAPTRYYLKPADKAADSGKGPERQQRFLNLNISTLEVGKVMVLENIYFYPGRHVVREDSYPVLNELYEQLKDHPAVRIRVEGHVCCVNAPDALDNDTRIQNLSVSRAAAIRSYLISKGIDGARIEFTGFGRSQPAVPIERTEEDANKNRRVEIRVIE